MTFKVGDTVISIDPIMENVFGRTGVIATQEQPFYFTIDMTPPVDGVSLIGLYEWDMIDASAAHAEVIAKVFANDLRDHLTASQWREMRHKNMTAQYGEGVCASHDYLDANESMAAAFEMVMGRPPDVTSDQDSRLWSEAWDIAKATYLTEKPACTD